MEHLLGGNLLSVRLNANSALLDGWAFQFTSALTYLHQPALASFGKFVRSLTDIEEALRRRSRIAGMKC